LLRSNWVIIIKKKLLAYTSVKCRLFVVCESAKEGGVGGDGIYTCFGIIHMPTNNILLI